MQCHACPKTLGVSNRSGFCRLCLKKQQRHSPIFTHCKECQIPLSARHCTGYCRSCYKKQRCRDCGRQKTVTGSRCPACRVAGLSYRTIR